MYHFDGSSSESEGESDCESNSLSKYLLNRESLVASENDDFLLPEDNSSEQYEIDFDQSPLYDQENIYMNSTLNTKRSPLSSLHNRINTQTDSFQSNLNVSLIPFSSTQLPSSSKDNSITQFVQSKTYDKEELKQMIEDEVDDPKIEYISNNGHRQTSPIWSIFVRIRVNGVDQPFVKCVHCNLVLSANSSTTTSRMHHYADRLKEGGGYCQQRIEKDKHIKQQQREIADQLVSNESTRPEVSLTTEEKSKMKTLAAALSASALVPFQFFDNPIFQQYCQTVSDLGAKYGRIHFKKYTPSGKTVSRATTDLDKTIKENVKAEIKHIDDLAITADHWTDPISLQAFYQINAVYQLNNSLVCRQLACRGVNSKKCDFTAHLTDDILSEFDIPLKKVSGYVTDMALRPAYDPLAPLPIGTTEPREWVHTDSRFHACSRHRLATIQKDTFDPDNGARVKLINEQLVTCKSMVTKAKKTGIQRKLKDAKRVTLKQECATRFDTKHTMVESILANVDILTTFDNDDLNELFYQLDIGLLEKLSEFLRIWKNAGMSLSNEKKPTLCEVLPTRYSLRSATLRHLSHRLLRPLQTHFLASFDEKYFITPIVQLAAFLWPLFRNDKRFFTQADYKTIEMEARLILKKKQCTTASQSGLKPSKLPRLLQTELKPTTTSTLTLTKEIEHYRKDFISEIELNLPVLEYWTSAKSKFPLLSSVARHVLVIPATQIASERRFNLAKLTLTSKRSSLAKERFEAQSNINKNIEFCPFIEAQTLSKLNGRKRKSDDDEDEDDSDETVIDRGGGDCSLSY